MMDSEDYKEINRLKEILGFKIPLDGLMMMALQKPIIDILRLDEILIREHHYEGSMDDFIKSKFGDEALKILNNNIL